MLIANDGNNRCMRKDSAKFKDIRWSLMKKDIIKRLMPYEQFLNQKHNSKEYWKKIYPTEEDYKNDFTSFYTYAVVTPDGEWYEPGKMGWWGISSATSEEEAEFEKQYEERFLKTANPEWTLTIVDCHI